MATTRLESPVSPALTSTLATPQAPRSHEAKLPTAGPALGMPLSVQASISAPLPADLIVQLRCLAADHLVDLPVVLGAAFTALLARYTANDYIRFGMARPARANSPLTIDLTSAPSGAALVQQLREHHAQLFESCAYQPAPSAEAMLCYSYQPEHNIQSTASYRRQHDGELCIELSDPASARRTSWRYQAGRFEAATIARMHDYVEILLRGMLADPARPVNRLPLLTDADRHQALVEWNSTTKPYALTHCIHELFEAQVARTPTATALIFADEQLSYRELNRRANRLAHQLRQLGVGADTLVGLCMDRSPEQIVSVLAILKAGGAYVPLDPSYPRARLALMIDDTQAPVILTQQHLAERLPDSNAHVLCVDDSAATTPDHDLNLDATSSVDSLAYVIYTSGSTGTPKGVLISHLGLVNHTYAMIESHALDSDDRVLQFSSLGFDASAATLFPALIAGAALVLPSAAPSELLGDQLTQLCERERVSILQLPASVWHRWVDDLMVHGKPFRAPVKVLLVGGESPSLDKLRDWTRLAGRTMTFLNAYGPTEATITATLYSMVCDEHSTAALTSIPMGRPLANKQIFLLDSQLQPVPIGAPGELYIGGIGLARGYLNRPELTAERFIDWQHTHTDGSAACQARVRLYRTGDLARYRPDGNLEFLGRIDHQVKLRGFRIELGEIESTLRQHVLVRDAVVQAREDTPGLQRLVAYIVTSDQPAMLGTTQISDELRAYLRARMPDYMVPSAFVPLAAMPLTHNGKIDRRALPPPELYNPPATTSAAPRTSEEAVLADIWASVLGRPKIGIHDDFFALGGHSLLAARAVVLVNTTFKRDIPLRVLYEAPTVAAFAAALCDATPTPTSVADLIADVTLDPGIILPVGERYHPGAPAQAIFLTGGTGYLGAFLLAELLTSTSATIYCLTRAATQQEAEQRIQRTLAGYQIWQERWRDRIIAVIGDLRQPRLGLNPYIYEHLAETIDVIYHAGAQVHYLYPYSALRASNVQGSVEVLRLACRLRLKPVHYVSTIGVAAANESGDLIQAPAMVGGESAAGYAQSKWVTEGIMQIARARGVPITIYRPGRIGSHSQSGVANPGDFLVQLLAGCMQLGLVPDLPIVENLIPVDYTARAIVHLSQLPTRENQTIHLLNPQPTPWYSIIDIANRWGYALELVPFQPWYRALRRNADSDRSQVLHSLLLLPHDQAAMQWINDWMQPAFMQRNAADALADAGLPCPRIDAPLLERMFADGVERGLFVPPAAAFNMVANTALIQYQT